MFASLSITIRPAVLRQGTRMQEAERWVQHEWPAFEAALHRAGWQLERVALGAGPWRAAWGDALPSHAAS